MNRPELTVIVALRYTVVALTAYLALVTIVNVLARLTAVALLARARDLLTPAVIGALLGVPTLASAQTTTTDPPIVMHRLPDATPAPTSPTPAVTEQPRRTWTIRPGEHFWAVAEHVLAEHLHRPPTDAEIVPYWQTLIAANRDRLRDRTNPDLVFPGQVFVVPDVS